MAGGIILSNRLARMQQATRDLGDTFTAINEQNRRRKLEDEDRLIRNKAAATAQEAADLQLGEFKRRDAARQEAEGLAGQLTEFGQAVPDSTITAPADGMLPGFQGMRSERPAVDVAGESLKDRIRASWMNAEARSKGETAAFTAADVKRQREEAAAAKAKEETAAKRKKETEDRDYALDERRVKVSEREAEAREAITKAPKPPTESQSNAALFGRRMEQAMADMDALAQGGHDASSMASGVARAASKLPGVGNYLTGGDTQQQQNAETNFLTAVLRKESGASISPTEFASGERLYFPRSGDSKETLAQKRRNREQALAGLQAAAGSAWETVAPVTRPGGSLADASDEDLDARLRARGIDPVTGKRMQRTVGRGASGTF